MTMVITIDHGTAEADTSADSFLANVAQDNVVPAPPTLALAGIGISGLGLFGMIRRRRRA
jgi:MYXO-CTERM domain-containing protein